MKKIICTALALVLTLSMLAGCAPSASASSSAAPAAPGSTAASSKTDAPKEVVEVVLPTYRAGEDAGAKFFLPQVERFNKKYEGVYHITIEESPSNTHNDRIKQLALQNKLPTVFQVSDSKWVKDYLIANNKLEDLTSFIESNPEMAKLLIPGSVEFSKKIGGGKLVTLPLMVMRPMGLYYNSTMTDFGGKKVTDLSWDEFAKGLNGSKIAFQTAEGGWTINLMLSAMIGGIDGGIDLLTEASQNEKLTNFENPILIQAFGQLQKLYASNGWEGAIGATYPDAATGFYGKKSAVLPDGTWIIDKVNDPTDWSNGFDGATVVGDYYPGNIAVGSPAGYDWLMPVGLPEDQKAAGLAFFAFICSPEEIEAFILAEGGTNPNITYSESFKSALSSKKLLSEFATGTNPATKYVPAFNEAISASLFTGDFSNFLPKLLKGEWSPEQFATELGKAAVALG